MKKLIILLISFLLIQCKKKDIKPEPEYIPITPCIGKGYGIYSGTYYHTFNNPPQPEYTDTVKVIFIKDDCNTTQYKISNLYKVYSDLGIEIQDRNYYININENSGEGNIQDTMTTKVNGNGILISMKSIGVYVDLSFKKKY